MGKSTRAWVSKARRTILVLNKEAYDDAPEGKKWRELIARLRDELTAAEGPKMPKSVRKVCALHAMTVL